MFFTRSNEENVIDSFYVTSDFDKNKFLYRIPLNVWISYIEYIVSDNIVRLEANYDKKSDDYKYSRKVRGTR